MLFIYFHGLLDFIWEILMHMSVIWQWIVLNDYIIYDDFSEAWNEI